MEEHFQYKFLKYLGKYRDCEKNSPNFNIDEFSDTSNDELADADYKQKYLDINVDEFSDTSDDDRDD